MKNKSQLYSLRPTLSLLREYLKSIAQIHRRRQFRSGVASGGHSKISTALPSSSEPVILSEDLFSLLRCYLSLVNPRWVFPVMTLTFVGLDMASICSIPEGLRWVLTGLYPPFRRWVRHLFPDLRNLLDLCDLSEMTERPYNRPILSAPSDASCLAPWTQANPGTSCVFNKGTVFKTLTLQIGHLRHDHVYLQKTTYILIWLSIHRNVRIK